MQADHVAPEVPRTGEAVIPVVQVHDFIHTFSMPVPGSGEISFTFEDLLSHWLARKGEIRFKKMTIYVVFEDAGGRMAIGFTGKDNSVSSYSDILGLPNRFTFGSNSFNTNVEMERVFEVPAGFESKIFPATGALPLGRMCIANKKSVAAHVTLMLQVTASGPYVHRYSIDFNNGSVKPLVDFV